MKAKDLIEQLKDFRKQLAQHKDTYTSSLNRMIPQYPESNITVLKEESEKLCKSLGRLRPYILRFRDEWTMHHRATGSAWNVLDASVGLDAVAQAKCPSINNLIQGLDQIIGELEAMDPEDEISSDSAEVIKSGAAVDKIMLAYLDSIHPFIATGCNKLFLDTHYAQAIEESSKAVFQYIRDKTGLSTDGARLAEQAFSLTSPMLSFSNLTDQTKKNEQLGFMEMLKGFSKGVRNTFAHSHGKREDAQIAFEYMVMASLFCHRIDDACVE